MTDKTADKKTESINALKNANKHLADLFSDLAKKDAVMSASVDNLNRIAQQCGDLKVNIWHEGKWQDFSLRGALTSIAARLTEARS